MEYNASLRECPNCGAKRPNAWRQILAWRWPLPLAIGLAVQLLSQRLGPEPGPSKAAGSFDVASVSQFIAGMLVFSVLAAMLLFVGSWIRAGFRRRAERRRRRLARRQPHR